MPEAVAYALGGIRPEIALFVFCGSLLAGFVNTVASHGSLITLPLLIFAGASPIAANATNRLGVIAQCSTSLWRYRRAGNLPLERKYICGLVAPTVAGSVAGTLVAIDLSELAMKAIIGAVMAIMFVVVLFRFDPKPHTTRPIDSRAVLMAFALGVYGGLIQAGVSLLLLALLAGRGLAYREANGIKLFIVWIFTVPSALIFTFSGKMEWMLGTIVVLGQAIGAWVGAHAAQTEWMARRVRGLLLVLIAGSIVKLFWPA